MNHLQKYELVKYAGAAVAAYEGKHPEQLTYGGGALAGVTAGIGGKPLEVKQMEDYRDLRYRNKDFPEFYSKVKSLLGPNNPKTKAIFQRGVQLRKDFTQLGRQLAPEFQNQR